MSLTLVDSILSFWFGPLDTEGMAADDKRKQWFAKDDSFDARIRSQFGTLMELAPMGAYDLWTKTPHGSVALIVLLDQFSRNLFRNHARAFYVDEKARVIAGKAVADELHLTLPISYAYFILMPFMHAEDIESQDRCVTLFAELESKSSGKARDMMKSAGAYAVLHREIISRFGRFPHRNLPLNRVSTDAEKTFLLNGGPTF